MPEILRSFQQKSLTFQNNGSGNYYYTDAIDIRRLASGYVGMPATWTAANLVIEFSLTQTGTFGLSYKNDAVTQITIGDGTNKPTANKWYEIPPDAFGLAGWIRFRSQNGSGTDVDQTTGRTLEFVSKG